MVAFDYYNDNDDGDGEDAKRVVEKGRS